MSGQWIALIGIMTNVAVVIIIALATANQRSTQKRIEQLSSDVIRGNEDMKADLANRFKKVDENFEKSQTKEICSIYRTQEAAALEVVKNDINNLGRKIEAKEN